jgi:hypothetical protein
VATALFNLTASVSGSNGTGLWIDLGLIPSTYRIWIGSWTVYGAKADSFYLYGNKIGKSAAVATDCTLVASCAIKAGATATQDLYKKGTLHTVTAYSTGVEHWWINITSKSSTLAAYNCKVLYTTE